MTLRPGWVVLASAILSAGLTGPGQTTGVSVFIDHFVRDLALSPSLVSTAYLIGTLIGAVLLPVMGRFIDSRGVRVAQIVIGLAFGIALANMSLVDGFVWLAIGFAGIRFLGQGSLSLVSTVTVQLRFRRTRGTALGILATASSGLVSLTPVVLALVIAVVGWRATWLVAAVVVVIVVVPLAVFGLGDLPRGTHSRTRSIAVKLPSRDTDGTAPHDEPHSFSRREALATPSFWMLGAINAAVGMMSTALNFHQIDLLGAVGISKTAAAALFIPQVVGSSIAGLAIGYLSDRVGTRYLPAVGMLLLIGAQLLAAAATPGFEVIAYAIVLGATGGAVRTASSILPPNWFGLRHVGSIQSAVVLFSVGASAIGPLALTLAEQALGSYSRAALVLCTVPIAALIFALGPNTGPATIEPIS